MPYKDPEKQKEYLSEHYLANKEKYRISAKIAKQKRIDWVNTQKDKPCADCKKKYPHYVMHFDHLGNKEFGISDYKNRYSIKRLQKEINKCEVVCANCHAIRTYGGSRESNLSKEFK